MREIWLTQDLYRLVYRATQVLNKPLDELASLLGFDIPLTPRIDLAAIKADGAIVHWTLPAKQKQKNTLKYEFWLNGNLIDTVSIHETAVQITGLQPGAFYVVRVALVNSLDFSSKSLPIRFRTKPSTSGDFFTTSADGHETDHEVVSESVPRIRPYRGLKDITPASPTSAVMEREPSSGGQRRTLTGRRSSPGMVGAAAKHDPPPEDGEPPEGNESVQQLTEKLDALRRENDEAERQAREEEEEEQKQREDLTKERDRLKAEAGEKEKASRNLKRDVNILERQNTAAQNERSKQERLLQNKKQDRQKLKDDMVRWEREAEEMKADVERIQNEKTSHVEKLAKTKEELRAQQAEETAKVRTLDDEIKEKTAEIKKLERALKNVSPNGAEPETHNLVEQLQKDAEEERQWAARRNNMLQEYQNAYSRLENSKRFYQEQHRYLESLRAERRRQDEMTQFASPPPQERVPRRGDSQRSRHAPSRHSTSDSPRLGAFPPVSQSPFSTNSGTAPITNFQSAPFLDLRNGMTIPGPTGDIMTEEDKERLTGGAMMSPGVEKDLLPAGLFNAMDERKDTRQSQQVAPLPGLGQLPGLPGLPGPAPSLPAQQQQDIINPGPTSPGSASSRSPSVFASPQASQNNLQLGSPENMIDADRRSIRSTRSTRATSGGGTSSRFSGMFGIKQRSKANNLSDDIAGPPLGKANSMPRQDPFVPGLDSAARKRNSSISGSMAFGDQQAEGGASAESSSSNVPLSRRAFGLFSKDKSGGWPSSFTGFGRRPVSPRPGSTHSSELPRPSMDSSRWGADAWPSADAAAGARGSPLAFGPGWNMPGSSSQGPRLYGSRHPSRRPSVQYGATGPPEDIMEDSASGSEDDEGHARHRLAPIGTSRPAPGASSKKGAFSSTNAEGSSAPKLNPNAKDFKSFFSSMKLSGRKDGSARSPGPEASLEGGDDSPPASRKSRDARSMATTESYSSLLDPAQASGSGRESADLARVPSYTASYSASSTNDPTPAPSPSLAGSSKESFMAKITRKSSSGKFSLPAFARNKSRLDPSAGAGAGSATSSPAQGHPPAEDDEDALSASVGSLSGLGVKNAGTSEPRESKDGGSGGGGGNRSSRSWSSVLKLGRKEKNKAENETPSLSGSGMSVASETDEGDGDGEGTEGEDDGVVR